MREAHSRAMSELLVCPLDFRYGRPAMKRVFSEEGRLEKLLHVEAALVRAHAAVGNCPAGVADEVTRKATLQHVKLARVKQVEEQIRHDLMAVVQALAEQCGPEAGRYVHLGATSYDIIDTANALMLRQALDLLEDGLQHLLAEFARLARAHRDTLCVGRTHGQHAVPMTFGLKMAVMGLETQRHLERLRECRKRVVVGKLTGAVGTAAGLGPRALDIQQQVALELGLAMEDGPTQIVQRDRLNELLGHVANLAASLEKFATEVRNLQRNEILEVQEGFDVRSQVGSSTMAQKRNPVESENVTGLARVVRGFVFPAYENAVQWHERDLSNSSGERFIVPHALILTDHIVQRSVGIFHDLRVFPQNMRRNLLGSPEVMSESVMVALVGKGLARQQAHEAARRASMRYEDALLKDPDAFALPQARRQAFKDALMHEPDIASRLKGAELDAALEPANYTGAARAIVDRALQGMARDVPQAGR
jgi:adenylosuccinate lyase